MTRQRIGVRTTTAAVAATLIGLPVALTGCGQSHPPATGAAACPINAPGVTANSIKIGYIYPDTGPGGVASAFRDARSGAQARVDQQNAQGGINGRQIDLEWRDDQSEPETFSVVAHDLVNTQKVFGLITTSIALDKSAPWLAQQGVPVTGTATSVAYSDYPNIFHSGNLFNTGGSTIYGDFVKAAGGHKAMILIDPTVSTSATLAAQLAPSLQSRGIEVVGSVTYVANVTDTTHVAQQLKQSGADTLIGAAQPEPFIDIYSAAKQLGVNFTVALNSSGYNATLLATRGTDMAGMSIPSSIAPLTSPPMIAYRTVMSTYAPEVSDPTDELAVSGYVAADEMITGLQRAGTCPTRQAFIANLRKETDYTAGGISAPTDLTKPKQPTLCRIFVKVDSAGNQFITMQPPAALNKDGYWCGEPLQ
ncbi:MULTISPECIES: ABC transporter substrate-binding protein [Pseudofrankia]|uniref:ABC transporter substrate-binding protein n=1 Tax=Pseudofrankia TaxID=2994363 RepID=UPI000234B4DD|nr:MULTISPECIES: ABC transporter substrate-binding protein [Pseudofrankia]OHV30416.1 Leu/Ile/Val-binding protein (LIV-BP) [Pseudofrankia sp. EUN1h]